MNSEDCIFCKIVKGEIPSTKVYEDDICIAFMDIFPVTEGHCLLIPKEHYTNMLDADSNVLEHLVSRLSLLDRQVANVFEDAGILNVIANGKYAGQEVPHLHFHIIPRKRGDAFGFKYPEGYRENMAPREELELTAKRIRDAATEV